MSRTARDARDVCLGRDTGTGKKVWLRYEDRVLGVTIIGKAGTGKSTILENLVLSDLANGTPGVVIDPHGQLAEQIIRRATAEQAERIFLLEAIRTKPFGLNLLAVRDAVDDDDDPVTWAADSVVSAVKRLYREDDEFLPRLEYYLDLAVRTLIPSGLTLLDAPRLFTDKAFRNGCLSRVADVAEQEKLRTDWAAFDPLRPGERITHTEALANRLKRPLAAPLIQGIVGSKRTTVPFDRVLAGNSMIIVSLPSGKSSPERCNFVAALLLHALADRIFARNVAVEKPPRVHLYVDEYQRYATTTTADLLTQGRKYEVGLTLAHQDLHQIRDSYIRNSARHAGTLILLAVTRPDAEDLAGEFPLEPREEWIETIREIDGTESKLVPSATQAEDIYLAEHSDELVDLAARSLLTAGSGNRAKSYGAAPRPGGQARRGVQIPASDVNALLYKAANGELTSPEALTDFLTEALAGDEKMSFILRAPSGQAKFEVNPDYRAEPQGFVYYGLHMESPDIIPHQRCTCPGILQNPFPEMPLREMQLWSQRASSQPPSRCSAEHDREKLEAQARHNTRIWEHFDIARQEYKLGPLREWLSVHVQDRQALCDSVYTEAFRRADETLQQAALADSWWELFKWRGGRIRIASRFIRYGLIPGSGNSLDTRRAGTAAAIELLRERLRLLLVLCDGVSRHPIMVPSGEQQPKIRTHHIVHPRQTEQDALNEFAGKLVHPPEPHVAHVRMPQSYHRVKLAAPSPSIAPELQVHQVRKRSQQEYHSSGSRGEPQPPGEQDPSQQSPAPGRRITRRPGGEAPRNPKPQEDKGEDDDSAA